MVNAVRLLSVTLVLFLLGITVASLLLGIDGVSFLLGLDIANVSIVRPAKTYEFSLVNRLPIVLAVVLILVGVFTSIVFKAEAFVAGVREVFILSKRYLFDTYRLIKESKVKYFLLISFFTTLFLSYFFPLTLDEPQTYYDFIKPPFWEALVFYPYPNNHILSSILSNITNEFTFLDLLLRIRIPVIIVSLLTWILAYRFVRKFYSENLALFVVAIGSVVTTNLQHAYIARGYAYVMFFVVVGLYAAYNIIENNNRKRDWIAFAVSSALGAWAMPSYLYPFLSISFLIFIYNYKHIKTQIFYSALVGVFVFLFYSPILIVSGLDAITSNEFVETIGRITVLKSIPGFMLGTVVHIFYVPFYLLIAIFGIVFLYVLKKRDKKTLVLWAVFCITPCLFLLIHSVLPFFRTFFYYGFIFVFLIGVSFKDEIKNINSKGLFIGLLVVHIAMLLHFFSVSRELMIDVFLSNDLRTEVLEDNKSYYINDAISWIEIVNMEFEAERKGYNITVVGGNVNNAESLQEYDYCLIGKKRDVTKDFTPYKEIKSVFSTEVNIYRNN